MLLQLSNKCDLPSRIMFYLNKGMNDTSKTVISLMSVFTDATQILVICIQLVFISGKSVGS